jgi:hypothetical protein
MALMLLCRLKKSLISLLKSKSNTRRWWVALTELEKERVAKAELEDPKRLEAKVQSRLKLVEQCRAILGNDFSPDDKTDEELKLEVIKHFYPHLDLADKEQGYLDGMFAAISALKAVRNDSLASTRKAMHTDSQTKSNHAYEKWLEQSAKMWTLPLAGKN